MAARLLPPLSSEQEANSRSLRFTSSSSIAATRPHLIEFQLIGRERPGLVHAQRIDGRHRLDRVETIDEAPRLVMRTAPRTNASVAISTSPAGTIAVIVAAIRRTSSSGVMSPRRKYSAT